MFESEFTSESFIANPAPHMEQLRKEGPLVRRRLPILGKCWITTTQAAAAAVLKNNTVFTQRKKNGKVPGMQWWMPRSISLLANNMLTTDEPDHTRLRTIVDQAFHRRQILDLQPRLEEIADDLVANLFKENPTADLVQNFARIFPLAVICELLGLPEKDRDKFMDWAGRLSSVTGLWSFVMTLPGISKMNNYLTERIEHTRNFGGEGLIAELVQVQRETPDFSDDELLATIFILLVAGHETTTHLISGGVHSLLTHPDQKQWLQEDWVRLDLAVEEIFRFNSSVSFTKPRYAQADHGIEGVLVKAGDLVLPMLIAANFDPEVFENPEVFDLSRKPNRHMAFGSGIHFCLGHQLARLEARIAFKTLFKAYPELSLSTPEPVWRRRLGLRALEHLHLQASA